MLNPCTNQSCQWIEGETSYSKDGTTNGWLQMTGRRWYPTVETLEDGTLIVIGGDNSESPTQLLLIGAGHQAHRSTR
jgi:hypothetical protein